MYTPEQITDAFEKMPRSVRHALDASKYQTALSAIGTANKLPLDIVGALESQILLTAVGLAKAENFGSEVSSATGLSGETLATVVSAIDAQIFIPLKELIKKYGVLDKSDEEDGDEATDDEVEEDDSWKDALLGPDPEESATTLPATQPAEIIGDKPAVNTVPDLSQFAQKLSTITPSTMSTTDQSIKVPQPSGDKTAPAKGFDPYRELPE
jgi:hypothetical protein